jgi:hypothetical protein
MALYNTRRLPLQVPRGSSPDEIPYTDEEKSRAQGLMVKRTTAGFRQNPFSVGAFEQMFDAKAGSPNVNKAGNWGAFFNHFGREKMLAEGRGNRYNTNFGSISGGGDINQRDESGVTPTFQVNAPPGLRTLPGDAGTDVYTGRSLKAPRAVDRLAAGGSDGMTEMELYGLSRNPSPLARQLLARTRLLEQNADLGDMDVEDRAFRGPGSQAAVDEEYGGAARQDAIGAASELSKARTFFDPLIRRKRDTEQEMALERSTAPARVQGELSIDKAGIERDARVRAAQETAAGRKVSDAKRLQDWMAQITNAAKNGTFGVDRAGNPNPPPQELIDAATRTFSAGIGGGMDAGGGNVPSWVPPDLAGRYEEARNAGFTDEEIRAFLSGQ